MSSTLYIINGEAYKINKLFISKQKWAYQIVQYTFQYLM